jgi:hypothetical protein
MSKKEIRNIAYKDFYAQHILRPYWSMVSQDPARPDFSDELYFAFYEMADNEAWEKCVFERLAQIYDRFDPDFFPGLVGQEINESMKKYGMREIP